MYRYRVNQLLEIERVRTRIAADLHDDIAANLSSIAMFSQLIKNQGTPIEQENNPMFSLLDRILELSKESVTAIRDIIWAIDPKPENAYGLLIKARDTVINSCRAKDINFIFDVPSKEAFPPENLAPDKRKDLYLLIKKLAHFGLVVK
jgi:signal transduction histidine kinase